MIQIKTTCHLIYRIVFILNYDFFMISNSYLELTYIAQTKKSAHIGPLAAELAVGHNNNISKT